MLAGCAGKARQTNAAPGDAAQAFPEAASIGPGMSCTQLREAGSRAHEAREKAAEHQGTSWRVVFPIAVAVRYASAASVITKATASIDKASATATAKDCLAGANG
ncbi:MAG TPA: hypothetical protein VNB23_04835 [Ramlibacter sp.]|nr:hypothetical protein [Ramlibacter sp.]